MNAATAYPPETLEAIAFVGDSLGPLFLEDPRTVSAFSIYEAFAALDVAAACDEWPFGDAGLIRSGMELMVEGLAGGVDDDVVWEYRRLFVGPAAKAAPPWGSVYTDRDGVIFGLSTLDLRAWMRANGIASLSAEGDPDDHIGLMLLMMAWLCRHRPDALADFLQNHLLTWAPHFLERLGRVAVHPLYRGVAVLTAASLEGIRQALSLDVRYPRFYR